MCLPPRLFRRDLSIDAHHKNQPNNYKLALYKPSIQFNPKGSTEHDLITFDFKYPNTSNDNMVNIHSNVYDNFC